MNQEKAIKKMLLEIKLKDLFQDDSPIEEEFRIQLLAMFKHYGNLIWVVGWEERNKEFAFKWGSRRSIPVYRISLDGEEKVKFDNFTKAAKSVNGQRKFISRATKTGEIKYGYCWVLFKKYHKHVIQKVSHKS